MLVEMTLILFFCIVLMIELMDYKLKSIVPTGGFEL